MNHSHRAAASCYILAQTGSKHLWPLFQSVVKTVILLLTFILSASEAAAAQQLLSDRTDPRDDLEPSLTQTRPHQGANDDRFHSAVEERSYHASFCPLSTGQSEKSCPNITLVSSDTISSENYSRKATSVTAPVCTLRGLSIEPSRL